MSRTDPRSDDRPIRVLIVDPDRRVRRSLSLLIELADGVDCSALASDRDSAVAALEDGGADVCLIDPRLPDIDGGIALMAELRERWPSMGIVAMSLSDESEHPCLDGGADAFVAKSDQPDALVDVLRTVAAGQGVDTR